VSSGKIGDEVKKMEQQKGSHTVYSIEYHVVWTTKYRYKILQGKIALRLREVIRQGCQAYGITIVRGSVGKDHVHLLISCPPTLAPSKIMQLLKGRSSKIMQEEFEELRKRYWGRHLWATGYFCRTVGTVTEEAIKEYIENQTDESNETFKIIEDA
jgi:putative transposase